MVSDFHELRELSQFQEPKQDEEIGPVQQTGETLAGVVSLLTSIFNGLTTFPVNTVHAV